MFDGFGIQYESSEEVTRGNENSDFPSSNSPVEGNNGTSGGRREIFQPYLVKFMCHGDSDANADDRQDNDRFVVYSASMDEHLEKENNFEDCIPAEVNLPLFISDDKLPKMMNQ